MSEDKISLFVSRIKNFASESPQRQAEFLVYFFTVVEGMGGVSASAIEAARRDRLHLTEFRTPQYISENCGSKGNRHFVKTEKGYVLERSYREKLSSAVGGRSSAIKTAVDLRLHASRLAIGTSAAYLEEAIGCFESGFYRAAIVMTWCLGYDSFRGWLFLSHLTRINAQMSNWKKPYSIVRIEDFDDLSERIVIDTADKAGLLTKLSHKVLVALLDQRNDYAHPSGRSVTEAVAEAFMQQVMDEVVAKLS